MTTLRSLPDLSQVDALLESVRAPSRTGTKARLLTALLDRLT